MWKRLKNNYHWLILFVLPLILIFSWFRGRQLIATGEEGLLFYALERVTQKLSSSWLDLGLGVASPAFIPRTTLFFYLTSLNSILPSWVSQAAIFALLMMSAGFGIFLLTKELFSEKKILVFLTASLFYILNLYSQTQVWNRFLTPGMFAWAFLPWFLFLWIKLTKERKLNFLFLWLAASFIFSNTFSTATFVITLWVPALIWLLFNIFRILKEFTTNRIKESLKIFSFGGIAAVFWFVVNIWWVYPYFKVGSSVFSEMSDWKTNFDSLRGVSQYFSTREILFLRQSFLFGENSGWFNWYSQGWVLAVSLLILVIVILGWYTSRPNKNWIFLTVLVFVGWFISKGSNPPFGQEFFQWLFSNFPPAAALRNPYEKFGIVWLLPYSVFFGLGLNWVYQKTKDKLRGFVAGGILVTSCGILVWPMWTGDIFARNVRVRVPEYYRQANEFLNLDKTDGRILVLPMIPGDGALYSWGYQGVEASEFLFDKPAVSRILRTKYADDKYMELYNAFINNKNYDQLLEQMNLKFLVLHHDLISEFSGASSSAKVTETLKKNPKINLAEDFGQLKIYKYLGDKLIQLFITEGERPPQIKYKKLSNTRYIVDVKDAKAQYKLIFKETFNDLWEARINGEKIENHFLVYNYANGWRIEKTGDYTIDVVFKVWPWE